MVDCNDTIRAAPLHFDRVIAGITANVEYSPPAKILWDHMGEFPPLDRRIVSQEMIWRSCHAVEIHILEPVPELCDSSPDRFGCNGCFTHQAPLVSAESRSRT